MENCAGVGLAAKVVDREGNPGLEVFDRSIRVNLYGTFNVMSHATRRMVGLDALESGERRVGINTASVAYEDGQVGQAALPR
ncbi:MAG: hypothetical protein EP318_04055 [Rhodobacteraceae bacterium]|nr:MAG: hypothetical protein EP318_04055 [Paracoccaceae bacterium]